MSFDSSVDDCDDGSRTVRGSARAAAIWSLRTLFDNAIAGRTHKVTLLRQHVILEIGISPATGREEPA